MTAPRRGLRVSGLACRRGGRLVFDGLSFEVPAGARAHLTGPNGSGKSSLLRILAGLSRAAAGDIELPAPEGEQPALLYVGHQNAVKPWLSVAENLAFWLAYTGSRAETTTVLDRAGLAPLADLPAGYLSYGQSRRLALARLWAETPALVLLDEPTVGLDAAAAAHLETGLAALAARGATLVVATHGATAAAAAVAIALDGGGR